ncbi:MAG TPA: hypothetical protein VGH14_15570 [Solirubrobacterales bacterium]|jgi:hypothetical protein
MDAILDSNGTTVLVKLRPGNVTGHGKIAPRLAFQFFAQTPRELTFAQFQMLRAELLFGNEVLGEGFVTGIEVVHSDYQSIIDVPVSRTALDFLAAQASGDQVDLMLKLSGWIRARDDNVDRQRSASWPPPGTWVYANFGIARQTELRFQVARSDWFSKVLQPIGTTNYISAEIAIPAGDLTLRPAANHLAEAQRAYVEGDDPTVFARCRAATEALPGATKQIFDGLSDPTEAAALNDLLRKANEYFHRGRHVLKEGEQQGDFPVTHADARFALNLATVLLGHVGHVLSRDAHQPVSG